MTIVCFLSHAALWTYLHGDLARFLQIPQTGNYDDHQRNAIGIQAFSMPLIHLSSTTVVMQKVPVILNIELDPYLSYHSQKAVKCGKWAGIDLQERTRWGKCWWMGLNFELKQLMKMKSYVSRVVVPGKVPPWQIENGCNKKLIKIFPIDPFRPGLLSAPVFYQCFSLKFLYHELFYLSSWWVFEEVVKNLRSIVIEIQQQLLIELTIFNPLC